MNLWHFINCSRLKNNITQLKNWDEEEVEDEKKKPKKNDRTLCKQSIIKFLFTTIKRKWYKSTPLFLWKFQIRKYFRLILQKIYNINWTILTFFCLRTFLRMFLHIFLLKFLQNVLLTALFSILTKQKPRTSRHQMIEINLKISLFFF